mmetsp:Transcript_16272/g.29323  ORF Transcript_16272/g.29323 Transcript_16272/m.29323 type:complete len:725 (-) Transcript_16272:113-2287(-)
MLSLIDLLHTAALIGSAVLLKRGQIFIHSLAFLVLVDAEAELDHAVDPGSKSVGLIEAESRAEEGSLEEEKDEVLDGLVGLVSVAPLLELSHDCVLGVDFKSLLRSHVGGHGAVAKGLGLHDALHVGRPTVLAGDQDAGGVNNAVGHNDLLHLIAKNVLHEATEGLKRGSKFLFALLLLLIVIKLKTLLGAADELLAIILLELLNGILINGVNHEKNFETLLLKLLKEGGILDGLAALTSNVINILLGLLHTSDVVLETGDLFTRLGGVVSEEVGQLSAILRVFMNAELEVLAERLVELVVVVLVIGNLTEHFEALLDNVLLDHLEDAVLLEHLTGDVKGEILRVNNTLDEVEPLRDDVLAVVHDENAADIKLDVVRLLLLVEHVERSTARGKQNRLELELTLNTEVLDGKMVLPVIGNSLVEGRVLLIGDLFGITHPNRLLLVKERPFMLDLLHFGLLLLLLLLLLFNVALLFLWLFFFRLLLLDLLIYSLLGPKGDRVADELTMLLYELLNAALFKILQLILLEVKNDLGTTAQDFALSVTLNSKRTTSLRFPDVLLIVVVLGNNSDLISNEVGGIKAYTKLTNHANIGTGGKSLHESLGPRASNSTKIVNEINLGHTDTGIDKGKSALSLVRNNVDVKLRVRVKKSLLGKRLVPNLVNSITSIADKFTKENLLVGVEGVNNERQQLVDLCLEGEGLDFSHFSDFLRNYISKEIIDIVVFAK